MKLRPALVVFVLAASAGLFFSAWSTSDFAAHLDRQVHSIHCSFIPGLVAADATGTTGCHVALMSPWSSVFRQAIWGGLPVTLPGMAVFAYLLYRGLEAFANQRHHDRVAMGYLALSALLPVLTSLFFGYVALVELDALCKLCMGIYGSSFVAFFSAVWLAATAGGSPAPTDDEPEAEASDAEPAPLAATVGPLWVAGAFGEGVAFVAVTALVYVSLMPDHADQIGACGSLPKPEDVSGVLVPLGPQGKGLPAIEVFDPLCPACRGFEARLDASGLSAQLERKALLFPLDDTCNWMVTSALHPGACTVSEAVLCAGDDARAVIDWAFEHQEEVRTRTAADPTAARSMVETAFPKLKGCVGSKQVQQRLNRSLRWAVANQLPVLTPQLYVGGVKLCDEDTDLGMDFALARLIERQGGAK